MSNPGHAHFGVAHCRRSVAINGAKVALPVHQHVAHRKWLCHADDGVVDSRIAVWVIFTDDITDDSRRLFVGLVIVISQFPHRVQDTAMHGFQAVPNVG